jgi:hypothetical protein
VYQVDATQNPVFFVQERKPKLEEEEEEERTR